MSNHIEKRAEIIESRLAIQEELYRAKQLPELRSLYLQNDLIYDKIYVAVCEETAILKNEIPSEYMADLNDASGYELPTLQRYRKNARRSRQRRSLHHKTRDSLAIKKLALLTRILHSQPITGVQPIGGKNIWNGSDERRDHQTLQLDGMKLAIDTDTLKVSDIASGSLLFTESLSSSYAEDQFKMKDDATSTSRMESHFFEKVKLGTSGSHIDDQIKMKEDLAPLKIKDDVTRSSDVDVKINQTSIGRDSAEINFPEPSNFNAQTDHDYSSLYVNGRHVIDNNDLMLSSTVKPEIYLQAVVEPSTTFDDCFPTNLMTDWQREFPYSTFEELMENLFE